MSKILVGNRSELSPLLKFGLDEQMAWNVLLVVGVAEIALGLALLVFRNRRSTFYLTILGMAILMVGSFVMDSDPVVGPSASITLRFCVILLAYIGLITTDTEQRSLMSRISGRF